jgi:pimeloyl-ACP methyl ester carboxylesterase
MSLFALVHGAWHGAWCWERLIPELEARGHRAVAMDLPIEDPSADWHAYADAVVAAIGDASDEVVLVGHSMGGHVIPFVAERRPVAHSVFLAAGLPVEESFGALLANQPDHFQPNLIGRLRFAEDGATSWGEEDALSVFYNDCAPEDAQPAIKRLRKQYMNQADQPYGLASFPNSPSTYIACARDEGINPAWARRVVPTLDMNLIEIDSSHSPFWSRPAELADILTSLASPT